MRQSGSLSSGDQCPGKARVEVRCEGRIGIIGNLLHREKLACHSDTDETLRCLLAPESLCYGFCVRCLKIQECQSQIDLALLGGLWKVT